MSFNWFVGTAAICKFQPNASEVTKVKVYLSPQTRKSTLGVSTTSPLGQSAILLDGLPSLALASRRWLLGMSI